MTIVVEPTIPFPASSPDLHNPERWHTLFPLIRPSVKRVQTSKGQHILVDTALAKSKHVHVVAICRPGHFSSEILDGRYITAVVTDQSGDGVLTAEDLPYALRNAGIDTRPGVVVVRAGKERTFRQHDADVVEVQSANELEQDHILHLLGSANATCRASIRQIGELLESFVNFAKTSHLTFSAEKVDGNLAVVHAGDLVGFTKARQVTERALKDAMQEHTSGDEQVTYSVHYTDVNGLSRLENYIIAGDIAQYFRKHQRNQKSIVAEKSSDNDAESQNISYTISHSTIVNHTNLARGLSISVVPISKRYLSPQPMPARHQAPSAQDSAQAKSFLHLPPPRMTFTDASIRQRIERGCQAVIAAEPTITEYDTIVGDGDCGYTLRDGAKQVLAFISSRDLTHLPRIVAELVLELEVNMGGTSGALYCIYLTALASSLAKEENVPAALKRALEQLMQYTRARRGDRTMMDALIPFMEALVENDGDVQLAVGKAREGVEGTKRMEAKLGRSTYLDESATRGVPDPGAYGLLVLLEGMGLV